MRPLPGARMAHPDADLVLREMEHTARLLRHACRRGEWMAAVEAGSATGLRGDLDREATELIAEQEALWLARSRPGGLKDSLARLQQMRLSYQSD
jgi:hypothetical protein